jgi:heme O synthase-like polyprenyltransferase
VVLLVPVSLLPVALGATGRVYAAVAGVLGLWLVATTLQEWKRMAAPFWGKRVFRASLVYLTVLFLALVVA